MSPLTSVPHSKKSARERIRFGDDIRTWEEHESPYKLVAQIFADRGVRTGKVGIEERTRFFFVEGIHKEYPGIELVSANPVTVGCRIRKSPAELALMQRANDITLKAYKTAVDALQEGMTHFEVSKIISAAHDAMGVRGGVGVQFGEYTAFPHGSSKPQVLKAGDVVMMDGGCNVAGYRSDITRTVIFGKPSDRQREIWDVERKAQDDARDAVKPGVPCGAIDDAARKVISDAGLGPDYKYFTHAWDTASGSMDTSGPISCAGTTRHSQPACASATSLGFTFMASLACGSKTAST